MPSLVYSSYSAPDRVARGPKRNRRRNRAARRARRLNR